MLNRILNEKLSKIINLIRDGQEDRQVIEAFEYELFNKKKEGER
jgi:hypothetical protein